MRANVEFTSNLIDEALKDIESLCDKLESKLAQMCTLADQEGYSHQLLELIMHVKDPMAQLSQLRE